MKDWFMGRLHLHGRIPWGRTVFLSLTMMWRKINSVATLPPNTSVATISSSPSPRAETYSFAVFAISKSGTVYAFNSSHGRIPWGRTVFLSLTMMWRKINSVWHPFGKHFPDIFHICFRNGYRRSQRPCPLFYFGSEVCGEIGGCGHRAFEWKQDG